MIFVSIASYRDKELIRTVNSCLSNAKNPNQIIIGICWQYDEEENITIFDNIPNIKIEKIYWKDVKGSVCWARKLIQDKLFNNEEYYFQVDSHTIFAKNWDETLIEMYNNLPVDKAVISIGPPYYYDLSAEGALPQEDFEKVQCIDNICYDVVLKQQKLDNITPSGHCGHGFKIAADITRPLRTRHISAALLFTIGNWVKEVPYDPEIYFTGEEQSLTLRSYTNGYDIFSPNKIVCWHLKYLFPNRKRHWNTFDLELVKVFEGKSGDRYKKIVCSEDGGSEFGIYGIGKKRSIMDWELYSGISFIDKLAHPNAYDGIEPNPTTIKDISEWIDYKNQNKK